MEMKKYKVLIDNEWCIANLSEKDYNNIVLDLHGELNTQYEITLENEEVIETGIIDDIIEFKEYVLTECNRQWNENQAEEYGVWNHQSDDTKAEYYNDMYSLKLAEC